MNEIQDRLRYPSDITQHNQKTSFDFKYNNVEPLKSLTTSSLNFGTGEPLKMLKSQKNNPLQEKQVNLHQFYQLNLWISKITEQVTTKLNNQCRQSRSKSSMFGNNEQENTSSLAEKKPFQLQNPLLNLKDLEYIEDKRDCASQDKSENGMNGISISPILQPQEREKIMKLKPTLKKDYMSLEKLQQKMSKSPANTENSSRQMTCLKQNDFQYQSNPVYSESPHLLIKQSEQTNSNKKHELPLNSLQNQFSSILENLKQVTQQQQQIQSNQSAKMNLNNAAAEIDKYSSQSEKSKGFQSAFNLIAPGLDPKIQLSVPGVESENIPIQSEQQILKEILQRGGQEEKDQPQDKKQLEKKKISEKYLKDQKNGCKNQAKPSSSQERILQENKNLLNKIEDKSLKSNQIHIMENSKYFIILGKLSKLEEQSLINKLYQDANRRQNIQVMYQNMKRIEQEELERPQTKLRDERILNQRKRSNKKIEVQQQQQQQPLKTYQSQQLKTVSNYQSSIIKPQKQKQQNQQQITRLEQNSQQNNQFNTGIQSSNQLKHSNKSFHRAVSPLLKNNGNHNLAGLNNNGLESHEQKQGQTKSLQLNSTQLALLQFQSEQIAKAESVKNYNSNSTPTNHNMNNKTTHSFFTPNKEELQQSENFQRQPENTLNIKKNEPKQKISQDLSRKRIQSCVNNPIEKYSSNHERLNTVNTVNTPSPYSDARIILNTNQSLTEVYYQRDNIERKSLNLVKEKPILLNDNNNQHLNMKEGIQLENVSKTNQSQPISCLQKLQQLNSIKANPKEAITKKLSLELSDSEENKNFYHFQLGQDTLEEDQFSQDGKSSSVSNERNYKRLNAKNSYFREKKPSNIFAVTQNYQKINRNMYQYKSRSNSNNNNNNNGNNNNIMNKNKSSKNSSLNHSLLSSNQFLSSKRPQNSLLFSPQENLSKSQLSPIKPIQQALQRQQSSSPDQYLQFCQQNQFNQEQISNIKYSNIDSFAQNDNQRDFILQPSSSTPIINKNIMNENDKNLFSNINQNLDNNNMCSFQSPSSNITINLNQMTAFSKSNQSSQSTTDPKINSLNQFISDNPNFIVFMIQQYNLMQSTGTWPNQQPKTLNLTSTEEKKYSRETSNLEFPFSEDTDLTLTHSHHLRDNLYFSTKQDSSQATCEPTNAQTKNYERGKTSHLLFNSQ